MTSKMGGYRKGAGFSKKGYIGDLIRDSTWEAAFVRYVIHLGLSVKRCDIDFAYKFKNRWHNYRPDFIVNGHIVEVKGAILSRDYYKWAYLRTYHKCKLIVVDKRAMTEEIIPFMRNVHPEMLSKNVFKLNIFDSTCKEYNESKTVQHHDATAERVRASLLAREQRKTIEAEKRLARGGVKYAKINDEHGLNHVNYRTLAILARRFTSCDIQEYCKRCLLLVEFLSTSQDITCKSALREVLSLGIGIHYNVANRLCKTLFGMTLCQTAGSSKRDILSSATIYGIPYQSFVKIATGEISGGAGRR